jgi:hypothetical protein
MQNPYQAPSHDENVPPPKTVSRRRLFVECIGIGFVTATLATIATTYVWDQSEVLNGSLEKYKWSPLNDLAGMLELLPVGMIIHSFLPTGWMFWAGCVAAVWMRRRAFFAVSMIGSMAFGVFWPRMFLALMSV